MDDEINNYHKNKKHKKISKKALALVTGITFFITSCQTINYIKSQDNDYIIIDDEKIHGDKIIEIPDKFVDSVAHACKKPPIFNITVEDLANIKELELELNEESDLSWIRYCINLKELKLTISTQNLGWTINYLGFLPCVESISIVATKELEFNELIYGNIQYLSTLRTLKLYGFSIGPNFLENMTQLKTLVLQPSYNIDMDYKKLSFLDTLDFSFSGPYNLAISFTTEDYEYLVKNGVNVIDYRDYVIPEVLEINRKLDNIIESLNLDKNASDQEKLDAILIYILTTLSYDENISLLQKSHEQIDKEIINSFYHCGLLNAAIEKDSSICGNYAALFDALAKRLGLKSFIAMNEKHAWNITNIDGNNYYVDATWLDEEKSISDNFDRQNPIEAIMYKNYFRLEWYLEDPTKIDLYYPDENNTHLITNLPSYIEIREIPREVILKINNVILEEGEFIEQEPKYEVKYNGKTWILSASAVVVLIGMLGIISKKRTNVKNKNKSRVRKNKMNPLSRTN